MMGVHAWCVLAALASCQHSAQPRASTPPDDTPFELEVTPRLRGSREAILRNGDQVVSRDRIKVEIKASLDAHVYIGYCDKHSKLALYPREGSIAASRGTTIYAPGEAADLVLDDHAGSEVLYVIASRRRLDLADPDLAKAMSEVRPGVEGPECAPLRRALGKTRPRKHHKTPEPEPSGPERKLAELERGAYVSWGDAGGVSASGDRDGIVVLRYTFVHVDK